ncbi:TnsA endonuclease C-terminal domain-containing protein [Paraburkholderia sp. J67]|uniref:TnsA endonuclease C-terminal domain-containing protein n=1 Tax=Paraburkholderia sp. J67 TaxID=2805435 RepID=UPI002ABD302D|nr:TnsA endonuclease C-terminal domain-containing protein [Paraburkholderia sp. J67]
MIGLSCSTRRRLLTRQHLGMLQGEEYVSPLRGLELPRTGLIHRFACARFENRTVELRSDTQLCVFMEQYFQEDVTDIREHVPALTTHTTAIAVRHGLQHPGGITNPEVLLTDLLITRQKAGELVQEAIQTRHSDSASTQAFRTECALLEYYWSACGASFSVCCRRGVDSPLARNLSWLFPVCEQVIRTGVTAAQQRAQSVVLEELTAHDHVDVREVCRAATRRGSLPSGTAVGAFRRLLATQVLRVDLSARDFFCLPPSAFTVVAPIARA